ncbi:MAG: DUF1566 domain-containing protein [Candidatus Ozemobacteraceae bacterium]
MKRSMPSVAVLFVTLFSILGMAYASDVTSGAFLKELKGARFTRDVQGVITDHQEELQWVEKSDVDAINWYDAQKWIKSLGGEWRMPNREELATLYVAGAGGGASKNMDPVFKTYGRHFWTGERARVSQLFNPLGKKGAYYINFDVKGSAQGVSELKNAAVGYSAALAVREAK